MGEVMNALGRFSSLSCLGAVEDKIAGQVGRDTVRAASRALQTGREGEMELAGRIVEAQTKASFAAMVELGPSDTRRKITPEHFSEIERKLRLSFDGAISALQEAYTA